MLQQQAHCVLRKKEEKRNQNVTEAQLEQI